MPRQGVRPTQWCAAGAGVHGLVVRIQRLGAFVRSAQCGGEIFARAAAGIDQTLFEELLPGGTVECMAPALRVGRERTAEVGAFLPLDAEPVKIFESGIGVDGAAAVGIEVFHAEGEGAGGAAGALKRRPEGEGVADVQVAGGRWGESATVWTCRSGEGFAWRWRRLHHCEIVPRLG